MKRTPPEQEQLALLAEDYRPEVLQTQMHEYVTILSGVIEQAADEIEAKSDDPHIYRNALRWKIQGVAEAQLAGLRVQPIAALLDTWSLVIQMDDYFRTGPGANAFGEFQPVALEATEFLREEITSIAQGIVKPKNFEESLEKITSWCTQNPLGSMVFARKSYLSQFAESSSRTEDVFGSIGAMEELAVAAEKSAAIYAKALPRQLGWQIELLQHDALSTPEVAQVLQTAAEASELMNEVPTIIESLIAALKTTTAAERAIVVEELRAERVAVLADIERQRLETLQILTAELETTRALFQAEHELAQTALAAEREIALTALTAEREAVLESIDALTARTVESLEEPTLRIVDHILIRVIGAGAAGCILLLLAWKVLGGGRREAA